MTSNSDCHVQPPRFGCTGLAHLAGLAAAAVLLASHGHVAASVLQVERPQVSQPRQAALGGDPVTPMLRVAQEVTLAPTLAEGRWQLDSERAHWQLRIQTADAHHVGLALDDWQFPPGALIHVHNDRSSRGPMPAERRGSDGRLWIPALPGDAVSLQVSMPAAALSVFQPGTLRLQYGTHDISARTSQIGTAGACHIHTACPQGDPWRDDIAATARILVGNSLLCSAVLVNNTAEDGDPLLLTADHCRIGSGPERFPASSVVALFNFESTRCDGGGPHSASDWLGGASLLYRHLDTDTALIRLDQSVPESFAVHFSGWDARPVTASAGAGIHHPTGDLKRISLFDTPTLAMQVNVTGADNGESQTVQAWRVHWAEGATEPGSSGSGLWNQDQRVVGVLSGGSSACNDNGSANTLPDFYGRLSLAWDSPGALGTPLRALLDKTDSGTLSFPGRAQSAIGVDDPPPGDADDSQDDDAPPPGDGDQDDGDTAPGDDGNGGDGDSGPGDDTGNGNGNGNGGSDPAPGEDDAADDPPSDGNSDGADQGGGDDATEAPQGNGSGSSGGHALNLLLLSAGLLRRRRRDRS